MRALAALMCTYLLGICMLNTLLSTFLSERLECLSVHVSTSEALAQCLLISTCSIKCALRWQRQVAVGLNETCVMIHTVTAPESNYCTVSLCVTVCHNILACSSTRWLLTSAHAILLCFTHQPQVVRAHGERWAPSEHGLRACRRLPACVSLSCDDVRATSQALSQA